VDRTDPQTPNLRIVIFPYHELPTVILKSVNPVESERPRGRVARSTQTLNHGD
jgi:hypothetical protein